MLGLFYIWVDLWIETLSDIST